MIRSIIWPALALMALPLPVAASPRNQAVTVRPDFSKVTNRAIAEALVVRGKLVRVLLFPAEFGGGDVPENTSFITPQAADARKLMIGTLRRFIKEGLIDHMTVTPAYSGRSIVPTRIVMRTSHRGRTGTFEPTIEIW